MITISSAENLLSLLSLLVAYLCSISLCGFCASWIALKAGDDTAERAGFLTLNPMMHFDVLGVLLLMFVGVGWGRRIPLDPESIQAKNKAFRVVVSYLATPVSHILLAFIALLVFVFAFGTPSHISLIELVMYGTEGFSYLMRSYPHLPSWFVSSAYVLGAMTYLNVLLASLYTILYGYYLIKMIVVDKEYRPIYAITSGWSLLFQFLGLLLLGGFFRVAIGKCIAGVAVSIASLVGIL